MATDTSSYDIATSMALINMLKFHLMDRPEVYRTLLAMLCDYEPRDLVPKKKVLRYMKLMITDQMLLKCLLVSLPEESTTQQQQQLRFKPIPKPDKILLPSNLHHNHVRNRKLRYGSGLSLKSVKVKKLSQLVPKKMLKHPPNLASAQGMLNKDVSTISQNGTLPRTSVVTKPQNTAYHTVEMPVDAKSCQVISSKGDASSSTPVSKPSMTRILQKQLIETQGSDVGQSSQGQCRVIPPQFMSPVVTSLPYPYSSLPTSCYSGLPYGQQYPDLTGYPTSMTLRHVLPWQPVNVIQPGVIGQIPASSYHQQRNLVRGLEDLSGMDLSVNSVKKEYDSKPGVESCLPVQHSGVSAKRILSADELLLNQSVVYSQGNFGIQSFSRAQNQVPLSVGNNVSLKNFAQEMCRTKPGGLDTSSLEALAELTSRIGSENSRIFLGARKSASTGSLPMTDEKEKMLPVLTEKLSGSLNAEPIASCSPQNMASMMKISKDVDQTYGKENEKVLMKSFPYSQEIKLPDGKYFLLNSVTERKILNVRSDRNPALCQRLNAPLMHGQTVLEPTNNSSKQLVKLHATQNNASNPKPFLSSPQSVDDQVTKRSATRNTKDNANVQHNSFPKCTIANSGENTCTIHLQNTVTNKLITDLLRKRARSDYIAGGYGPSLPKARTLSDSQARIGQGDTHNIGQNNDSCNFQRRNSVDVYISDNSSGNSLFGDGLGNKEDTNKVVIYDGPALLEPDISIINTQSSLMPNSQGKVHPNGSIVAENTAIQVDQYLRNDSIGLIDNNVKNLEGFKGITVCNDVQEFQACPTRQSRLRKETVSLQELDSFDKKSKVELSNKQLTLSEGALIPHEPEPADGQMTMSSTMSKDCESLSDLDEYYDNVFMN